MWLDERNLDKTKASWTDDALEAISDLDCMLLLFYVSSSSLTSEPCYRELKQTVDTQTMRIHFGPVRYPIAVDAENVGDISRFTHQLHSDLMHRKDISKQEKTNRAIILSQFCDEFFALNNERVRIHPKSEPNRKSNYYADILSAFPDEARLYEPTITLEALYGHAEPAKPEEPAPPEETAVQNADESAAEDKSTAAAAPQEESSADAAKAVLPETPAEPKETAPDLTDQIAALLKQKRSEAKEEASGRGDGLCLIQRSASSLPRRACLSTARARRCRHADRHTDGQRRPAGRPDHRSAGPAYRHHQSR